MNIRGALDILSFFMYGEWEFYTSVLDSDEIMEEEKKVHDAWIILDENNIDELAIRKHYDRANNRVTEPVRFIDRPHFVAVEVEELPF